MPDIMAIVSKAVFEKSSPNAKVGAVLPLRTYNSASKHLERLSSDKNSRLFLVTVRPPSEALWLVAVLESLEEDDGAWRASKRNRYPITDVSALRSQLKFESGTGIQAKPGALGMSLQTPRVLTPSDAALRAMRGGMAAMVSRSPNTSACRMIAAAIMTPAWKPPPAPRSPWNCT